MILRPGVHFLLRLRVLHPALAILVGMYLMFLAASRDDPSEYSPGRKAC